MLGNPRPVAGVAGVHARRRLTRRSSPPRLSALAGCGEQAAAPRPPLATSCCCAPAPSAPSRSAPALPARCPPGSPPPDGGRCTPRRRAGAATTVARIDVTSGRTLGSLRLPGRWTLPATVIGGAPDAATADGRTIVLARAGARATRFALVDASLRRPPRTITLPGRFAFDAISPDARRMFVIEPRTGRPLPRPRLRPPARRAHARRRRRQARAGEPMEGRPVARAAPAAGPWVYTLYRKA